MEKPISFTEQPAQIGTAELLGLFQAMLAQQSADNRETMLAAIAEQKKPLPEVAAKEEEDRARSMQLTMRRVEVARKQETGRSERQANCRHIMPNGKTNLRGQGNSNGYGNAYCSFCQWLSPSFALTIHEMTGGLNISEWGPNAAEIVKSRALKSPPAPPIPDIPVGASIIF